MERNIFALEVFTMRSQFERYPGRHASDVFNYHDCLLYFVASFVVVVAWSRKYITSTE